jgi:hypothetical protein
VAAAGLILNAASYNGNTKSRNLQVMRDFARELESLEESTERSSTNRNEFEIFVVKYLNVLDRISYLASNRMIPNELAVYFERNFEAALGLLERSEFSHRRQDYREYLIPWARASGFRANSSIIVPMYEKTN